MTIAKKTSKEFINDVIIPIEQKDIDSGNLYVLIRSQPNQSLTEYEEGHWAYDSEDWSFPTESGPGEWIEGEEIKLETLSGLVWRGTVGGRLYKADFEGAKKKIGLHDYWGDYDDYTRTEIEAAKHIDECISLGFEVKRARLIRRIRNWRPYLLWSFALDCIERTYSSKRDLVSDIYGEGIIFARAYSKYRCGMGGLELEGLVKASSASKDFHSLTLNKKYELVKLISERSELGSTVYLKKAVIAGFDPDKPFQAANYIRTAMTSYSMGEYREEYAYPGFATKDLEEQKIFNKIWYALHKKELEWQVDHLSKLIGD
jgi:hypothetical protein